MPVQERPFGHSDGGAPLRMRQSTTRFKSASRRSGSLYIPSMSVLTRITDHVYWLPPGPPDRPSLCAVVGDRRTLMLDAGSSAAHAREFLDALAVQGATRPSAVRMRSRSRLQSAHWMTCVSCIALFAIARTAASNVSLA